MWLFNVKRAVLRRAGRTGLPERTPQEDEQVFEMARQVALQDANPDHTWVFKVHAGLSPDLPRSLIITSLRDPRDMLVSFMKFMDTSFEHALAASQDLVSCADQYEKYPHDMLLSVNYEDIEARPAAVVGRVAEFLGTPLDEAGARDIAGEFTREKVRAQIEKTTADVLHRLDSNAAVASDEVISKDGQVIRAYDVVTGFQTGHVSGRPAGSWRTLLSDEQKARVRELLGPWMDKHGFAKE